VTSGLGDSWQASALLATIPYARLGLGHSGSVPARSRRLRPASWWDSIRSPFSTHATGPSKTRNCIRATFANWRRSLHGCNNRGHRVLFFPTQLRADPPVIEDVRTLLARQRATIVDDPIAERPLRSLEDLMLRLSMMDVRGGNAVCHGVLLAAALHRPRARYRVPYRKDGRLYLYDISMTDHMF